MTLTEVLQLLGGFIISIGAIPQIMQIIKTKQVKDINLVSLLSLLTGVALMETYAIDYKLTSFIITNTTSLILVSVQVGLKLYYTTYPPSK